LPEGPIGVQANFNGIWIRERCQKNLSEILPQLGELPFIRAIPVHAADFYAVFLASARKYLVFYKEID